MSLNYFITAAAKHQQRLSRDPPINTEHSLIGVRALHADAYDGSCSLLRRRQHGCWVTASHSRSSDYVLFMMMRYQLSVAHTTFREVLPVLLVVFNLPSKCLATSSSYWAYTSERL